MGTHVKLLSGELDETAGVSGQSQEDQSIQRILSGFLRALLDEAAMINVPGAATLGDDVTATSVQEIPFP